VELLSPYDRKARLIPGLLGIAPIAVVVATLGLKQFPAVAILLALASAAGGGYLLSVFVASSGRRVQAHLWDEWRGRPTTHLLRTREDADNPVERDKWRRTLSVHTGIRLLGPAKEATDPTRADHVIEAAVGEVLHYGQDNRFPILLAENAQYGLERNLYGFRWVGRAIAFLCMAGLAAALRWADWAGQGALLAGIVVCGLILLAWIALPSKARTRQAGFRYATQLFRAVVRAEQLKREATLPRDTIAEEGN
jgi:hypothetical protein